MGEEPGCGAVAGAGMKAGTQSVLPHRFYWVRSDTGERLLRCDICKRNSTRLKIITELEPKISKDKITVRNSNQKAPTTKSQ